MAGAGLIKATAAAARPVPKTRRRVSRDDTRNGSPPKVPRDAIPSAFRSNKPVKAEFGGFTANYAIFLPTVDPRSPGSSPSAFSGGVALCNGYLTGPLQIAPDRFIALVNIWCESDSACGIDESGLINQKGRDRLRQHAASGRALRDRSVDRLGGLSEQQGAEFARVLDAHTAVTLEPVVAFEYRLQRRVVQIDVETVRSFEFQSAERRAGPRQLLDPAIRPHDHVVPRQIVRIARQFRQDFLCHDRPRHIPRRIEKHAGDRRLQLRRLLVGLADNNAGR